MSETLVELDRLSALVGTVCPACSSEVLRRSDGEVFCWDVYCGQQLDAYRAALLREVTNGG